MFITFNIEIIKARRRRKVKWYYIITTVH